MTRLHVLFIVDNSGLSLIMFHGYKKQVNSASQSSLKNTGEQRGIKRSIRLCRAPLRAKTPAAGDSGGLSRSAGNPVERRWTRD